MKKTKFTLFFVILSLSLIGMAINANNTLINVQETKDKNSSQESKVKLSALDYTMDTYAGYSWYEIRRDGVHMIDLSNEDDEYDSISFSSWQFNFYETDYDIIYISSNGWMSFTNLGWTEDWLDAIPDDEDENQDCVALLCSDLNLDDEDDGGGDVYYYFGGETPNRYLIIEYYRAYDFRYGELVGNFEVIFHESGNIKFQYQQIYDVENLDPIIGLDHGDLTHYNSYSATLPLSSRAIKFIIDDTAEDIVDFEASEPDDDDDDDDDDGGGGGGGIGGGIGGDVLNFLLSPIGLVIIGGGIAAATVGAIVGSVLYFKKRRTR